MTGLCACGGMPRTRRERCSFIFGCELGDPVSSICLNDNGCMASTVLGKVVAFGSDSKVRTLTEFSDDGVRGLYLDENHGYAIFSDNCTGWKLARPHGVSASTNFRSLDKKNTQSMRYVLQRGPWACVVFPFSTTVVNVTTQEQIHRSFKLWEYGGANTATDVVPCDFDGENLLIVDRSTSGENVFRVVHLAREDTVEVAGIPGSTTICLARLWGASCIVCVRTRTPLVYDYRSGTVLRLLRGHQCEVVAMDTQDPDRIATMSEDAVVKLWTGSTGACSHSFTIPHASFFLGYPYCLAMHDRRILATADEGVFLIEYGDDDAYVR